MSRGAGYRFVDAGQHCPACRVVAELCAHRDTAAREWSARRAALNFAIVTAQRACPAYVPASTDEVAAS